MAESDVTIVVRSRDTSDPNRVRQRWRATGKAIENDSRKSGERSGKGWVKSFGDATGDRSAASKIANAITGSFTSAFKVSAKSAATAFSAQFLSSVAAGIASGVGKLAHGLGAVAALLPAVALAGGAAMGTLKLAVVGVGDAMEAAVTGSAEDFHEAVQGLSPPARRFALEVRHLRGDLIGLKDTVQGRFFAQFEGQTSRLGKTWLPILRRELGGISESFGVALDGLMGWARSPRVVLGLTMALRNVKVAITNIVTTAPQLAQAFLPLIEVGSTFLPRLTSGLGVAAQKFALFMQHAADTGALADFIQGGLDKLRSLGETAQQVWRIGGNLVDIFREFAGVGGGVMGALGLEAGGLLDAFELLTEKAKVFFATGSGGAAITEIFGILRSLLSATFGTLAHLVPIIAKAFAPIVPQLAEFAEAVVNLQFALADALAPALSAVADILGVILPPITDLMNAIAGNEIAAAGLAGALIGLYAAWKLASTASKLAELNISKAQIGMGGAAIAAGTLAMALIQIDAANHAKQIDGMVEAFTALDGAVNDQTKTMLYMNQLMGTQDEFVRGLIDSNPRLAQSLIDNAEAFGISADDAAKYQDELDTTTAAIDNQVSALERQKNALRGTTDPVFAAMDAQQRLAEAQQRLIDVQNDEKSTAADVAAAQQDVTRAAFDNEAAQLDLATAIENGDTSLKAYLKRLKDQRDAGIITEASYRSQAFTATAMFGAVKSAIERVPRSRNTTINARDNASGTIGKLTAKMIAINGLTATVNLVANVGASLARALGFFSHGGIVGAAAAGGPRGRRTWVGEHGPELVDLAPGSQVHSNPDSMRMAAQSGGGAITVMFDTSRADPLVQAIVDALRPYIQARHGGNVQSALGYAVR